MKGRVKERLWLIAVKKAKSEWDDGSATLHLMIKEGVTKDMASEMKYIWELACQVRSKGSILTRSEPRHG